MNLFKLNKRRINIWNRKKIFTNYQNIMNTKQSITVQTVINAPIEKVWEFWTRPEHITKWNNASKDWHTPRAENDLRVGGKFLSRMEAKDGSVGFDFWGIYDEVEENKIIAYTMGDDRKVQITFTKNNDNETEVIETFEAENENSIELQRTGWQAILDNFKKYVEAKTKLISPTPTSHQF